MSWVYRTVIVTAADVALARSLCAGLAGTPGSGMFTRELAPTAAGPATHYISSGAIEPQFDALLHDANAMFAAATRAGAAVTLAQCQALVNNSTVADLAVEGPLATIARLGLVFVIPKG